MPRPRREDERRSVTIRAVWAVIARYGIDGTTIERVAELGGFSKGVIHYYYESKRTLLLSAFEAFLETYDTEIQTRLHAFEQEPTAGRVIDTIIDATLPPFSPDDIEATELPVPNAGEPLSPRYKARLFLQFFPLAIADKDFAAIVRRSYERQGAAIAACFAGLSPAAAPSEHLAAAASLMALIDGLSMHRVIGYLPPDAPEHAEIARRYAATAMLGRKKGLS